MADVTKDDLHDVRDGLGEQMERGFERITSRLDVLNGRVGKSEVVAGEHGVRLTNVEREVWRRNTDAANLPVKPSDDSAAITKRDLTVAAATLGGAWAVGQALMKVVPWMFKALTP